MTEVARLLPHQDPDVFRLQVTVTTPTLVKPLQCLQSYQYAWTDQQTDTQNRLTGKHISTDRPKKPASFNDIFALDRFMRKVATFMGPSMKHCFYRCSKLIIGGLHPVERCNVLSSAALLS